MSANFEDSLAREGRKRGLDKEAGSYRAPPFTSEASHIFVVSLKDSGDIQHAYNN